MAVVIRLARHGAKKNPYYHIVVINSREARDSGRVLETLGKYDPMQPKDSDKRVSLKIDRIKDWMSKGAKPSDRVYKFLANAGMVAAKPYPVQTKAHLPSEKTQMKLKDREEKLKTAAAATAAAAATTAAEATVSDTTATVAEAVVEAAEAAVEPVVEAVEVAAQPVAEAAAEAVAEVAPEVVAETAESV